MVVAGLERENRFLRMCGREDASTATTPSEVGSTEVTPSGEGDSQMDDDFCATCQGPCEMGLACP